MGYFDVSSTNDTLWKSIGKKSPNQIEVVSVDFNLEANRAKHHTSDYEDDKLIVRRGNTISFDVELDAEIKKERIVIYMMYGSNPRISKGSLLRFEQGGDITKNKYWGMQWERKNDKIISVTVMIGCKTMIGEYKMAIDCIDINNELTRFQVIDPVIVLFNPWCKEDDVYMEDDDEIQEYVLSDTGRIYTGTADNIASRPWIFGQYDDSVLSTALYLIDVWDWVVEHQKGDIVELTRAMSALANSCDGDKGILSGNWTGDYTGGQPPSIWTGSVDVFEAYWKNRPSHVKYGQCWVFAGILTTLYRALGIPARPVTNFNSGHDHDESNTIDIHFDENGNSLSEYDDSTWNFHVWVEAWFKRQDLNNPLYNGWQALDATPQQDSTGRMQCGPAPLAAIRTASCNVGFDVGFVYSEVNGDIVYWILEEGGDMRIARIDSVAVGKMVVTKAVNSDKMTSVQHLYKAEEGSAKERELADKAACQGARAYYLEQYYKNERHEQDIEFKLVPQSLKLGESIVLELKAQNFTRKEQSVRVSMTAVACTYMGTQGDSIKRLQNNIFIAGKDTSNCSLYVSPKDYLPKMAPDGSLKLSVKAEVVESGQVYTVTEQFSFTKPKILLTPNKTLFKKGDALKLKIQLTNPLHIPLTEARIRLEVARNLKPININCGIIKPRNKMSATISVKTKRSGKRMLVATFDSKELKDIHGECMIEIKE